MSLYYLILWNQVDILQTHFRKDYVHNAPLDEVLRYTKSWKCDEIAASYYSSQKCLTLSSWSDLRNGREPPVA